MTQNSRDIDSQTYGNGFLFMRSDAEEIQSNVVGSMHRVQRELIGWGCTSSVPTCVVEDPATLNVKIGSAYFIDPNGKGFGWESVQVVSCGTSTAGAILGSTAPNAVGTLRYIVIAAKHKIDNQQQKFDNQGLPYYWKQISSYEILVYQTADIASPDDALANVTLRTLRAQIVSDGAVPIVITRRLQGSNVVDWVWVVAKRTFAEGDPVATREMHRKLSAFSALPIVANSSGTINVTPQAVPGSGGQVTIAGGEKIQIGWIDRSKTDTVDGLPQRLEITLPAQIIATPTVNTKYMLRMYIDQRTREPVVYIGTTNFGYLTDPDFGLLSTGTSGGVDQGSRPTLLDIPFAQIDTGIAGSLPTVILITNSVRTTSGIFMPWENAGKTWANSDPLGEGAGPATPIDIPQAIDYMQQDLKFGSLVVYDPDQEDYWDTGSDRIGAGAVGSRLPNGTLAPTSGSNTVQRMLSLLYAAHSWKHGSFVNPFIDGGIGDTGLLSGEIYSWQETWQGGVDYIDTTSNKASLTPNYRLGELQWGLWSSGTAPEAGKIGTISSVGTPAKMKFNGIFLKASTNQTGNLFLGQIGQATADNRTGITFSTTDRWALHFREVQLITGDGVQTSGRGLLGWVVTNITNALSYVPTSIGNSDYVQGIYFTTRPDLGGNWLAVVKTAGTETVVDTGVVGYGNTVRKLSIVSVISGYVTFMIDGVIKAHTAIPNDISTNRSYGVSLQARERLNTQTVGLYVGPINFVMHV